MALVGCVSEQEQLRQAEATYQANCQSEIEQLHRTMANRWDRRIAQNDVIVRCLPKKTALASALTVYARAAQQAVRAGKILDEDAWTEFMAYSRALDRTYQQEESRLATMRIHAAAQDLTELGAGGALSRRKTPTAAYQSTSAPRFSP